MCRGVWPPFPNVLRRQFFQAACDVPEPEEKFNVDEYSDMVTLSKPIIYISIEEIINTHSVKTKHVQLLFWNRDTKRLTDILLSSASPDPPKENRPSPPHRMIWFEQMFFSALILCPEQ